VKQVSVQQARENFADLVNEARYGQQPTEITKYGKPAAYLVSPEWFERASRALSGENHD
jgi:prevent-host-death family protein